MTKEVNLHNKEGVYTTTVKRVRIDFRSNDFRVLDESIAKIRKSLNKLGFDFLAGPLPIRTKSFKVTLNSCHHIYGGTKETYKLKTYRRVIWISEDTVSHLLTVQISRSVAIKVEVEALPKKNRKVNNA